MLLPFEHSKVRFQNVKIKRVTTALGGSVSILDEEHFAKTGKEKFRKVDIPLSLARMFKAKYKVTQFIVPHEGLLMWYDDKVITLEKATTNERFSESFDGTVNVWRSNIETHYKALYKSDFEDQLIDWYFDGLYVYNFHGEDLKGLVSRSKHLDEVGTFRAVACQAVHFTYLNFKPATKEVRNCVAVVIDKDTFSVSAPIWKNLGTDKTMKSNDLDDEDGGKTSLISSFKGVDKQVAINLNFALRAAKELADQFGYESIQPLQLPKMMIQLKTVNVPRLPKEVKSTTDVGLKFTHGLTWLLGLQYQATTAQQLFTIRQMIKYLMTKGYFWKEKTRKNSILVDKSTLTIPLFSSEQLGKTLSLQNI